MIPPRAEAEVLGRLLVIQGLLDGLPDRAARAERLATALREVPGVADAFFCFRGAVIPARVTCSGRCSLARLGSDTAGDPDARCPAVPSPSRCIALLTADKLHGFLILSLDATDAVGPYAPHLANIANYMAVLLERERIEDALRQADRRKDEFLAMLAHELRNPLAPIRYASRRLRIGGAALPELRRSLDVIDRQVEQLARLVDDLLDVSRITEGKIRLKKEPVELSTILSRAVEASRPLLDARGHRLLMPMPPAARLDGDVLRLTQVVSNLLDNAAKYTPHGGTIWLTVALEHESAVVRVKDNGLGIPAELLPYVFELFIQAHESLDRSRGGLGIGLTLVRRLVELHGGSVQAFSDGPGRGSEFVVTLPLSREERAPVPAAAGTRPGGLAGRRILVVDDNADAAEGLSSLLVLAGHDARVAHDGPTALAAARMFQPQAVFLDIGLPGMDGYEVARRLRVQPATRRTLLVAITGYGQESDRRRTQAAGFDHHLVKPVEWDALERVLASLGQAP